MRARHMAALLGLCIGLPAGPGHAALTSDEFLVRTTADLVNLCSATTADPMYTAAVNFCAGFTVGVFRVLQEEDMARPTGKLFCIPNPSPSRDQAIAAFVQWAKADPHRMALSGADGIATYLSQEFPCARSR